MVFSVVLFLVGLFAAWCGFMIAGFLAMRCKSQGKWIATVSCMWPWVLGGSGLVASMMAIPIAVFGWWRRRAPRPGN